MFDKIKIYTRMVKSIVNDEKAEAPVKALVMLFVIAILAGALLPTGIDTLITGSNASGRWTSSETTTYGIIALMIIVAVVLLIVRLATE